MFKILQGLILLHLLWNSTFSAYFWSLGISRHCILTLHRQPKQHNFTFSQLPFMTNSLKSPPLAHFLFHIYTQLFRQSQVTSNLVIISPYQSYAKLILIKATQLWGVSGPVVRALDSGSDGPGSSPGWGTTLWP